MELPDTYTKKNETGCCAVPNVSDWDKKEIKLSKQTFIKMHTKSFMFVPLNMAKVMTTLQKAAQEANAEMPPKQALILSRDLSPFKAEQLYAVSKHVPGFNNVTLHGTYLTQVFEGPYQNVKNWYQQMQSYAKENGKKAYNIYFFYTTCPKCAKHYGKNYVIGFALTAN